MNDVPSSLETLCDKEFDFGKAEAYEGLERDVASLKHQFASTGNLQSSGMARALTDLLLARFERVLSAFEAAYFKKWDERDGAIDDKEFDWLRAKTFSRLDSEILEVRSRCQSALPIGVPFAPFWQDAEVRARDRRTRLLQKLDIMRLRKESSGHWTVQASTLPKKPDTSGGDFDWELLHPLVSKIAKPRFENGHFADAVESCLKELNDVVRRRVLEKIGREYDGADLMNRAFSPQNPVITLDDLATNSGRDIQKGYLQLFSGAMTGIRNPKAHANVEIDHVRAIHLLFLASLLFSKLDEALARK